MFEGEKTDKMMRNDSSNGGDMNVLWHNKNRFVFAKATTRKNKHDINKEAVKSLRFTIWRRCVDSGFSVVFFRYGKCEEGKKREKNEISCCYLWHQKASLSLSFVFRLGIWDSVSILFPVQQQQQQKRNENLIEISQEIYGANSKASVWFTIFISFRLSAGAALVMKF